MKITELSTVLPKVNEIEKDITLVSPDDDFSDGYNEARKEDKQILKRVRLSEVKIKEVIKKHNEKLCEKCNDYCYPLNCKEYKKDLAEALVDSDIVTF